MKQIALSPMGIVILLLAVVQVGVVLSKRDRRAASVRPPTYPVQGRILYHHQPVAHAKVIFWPEGGYQAAGETDENGNFALTTFSDNDGAVPGNYHVVLLPPADRVAELGLPFPAKYLDPFLSDQLATVGRGTPTELTLVLND